MTTSKKLKIGLVARADRGGLAVESQEFNENMQPEKVLLVVIDGRQTDYELYPDAIIARGAPSAEQCEQFCEGLDMIFCFETPYNWDLFKIARARGVKTVLRINYEWLPQHFERPDMMIAPSLWNYENIPDPKIYLPNPINTEKIKGKTRRRAKTFVHIAGNGNAAWDRNGTATLIEAMKHVRSPIKLIIKSQRPIDCDDPRVEVRVSDDKNYWENWPDGDVFISPRRYAGQSLPLNEAMARGMAIMMTDMKPQNEFLLSDLLITPDKIERTSVQREFEIATISPLTLAKKIDEVYSRDITIYSAASQRIAELWSWQKLKKEYIKLFENICLLQ